MGTRGPEGIPGRLTHPTLYLLTDPFGKDIVFSAVSPNWLGAPFSNSVKFQVKLHGFALNLEWDTLRRAFKDAAEACHRVLNVGYYVWGRVLRIANCLYASFEAFGVNRVRDPSISGALTLIGKPAD